MAHLTGFKNKHQMLDDSKKYSLNVMIQDTHKIDISKIESFLKKGWEFYDDLFTKILTKEALYMRPIELRHPFIFYLCHTTSFEKNQIFKHVMKRKSSTEKFDEIFMRGMDSIVDDPSMYHKHPLDAYHIEWPSLEEIEKYKVETRKMVLESIKDVLAKTSDIMAQKGRVNK